MSQKELNYIEDIYNHEMLIINVINNIGEEYDDEHYSSLLGDCLKTHEDLNKKIFKLLGGGK